MWQVHVTGVAHTRFKNNIQVIYMHMKLAVNGILKEVLRKGAHN
jgi:hypothetical protein